MKRITVDERCRRRALQNIRLAVLSTNEPSKLNFSTEAYKKVWYVVQYHAYYPVQNRVINRVVCIIGRVL